jgi:hypothetical protein
MRIAAAALLALLAAPLGAQAPDAAQAIAERQAALEAALACRTYSDVWSHLYEGDPRRLRGARRVHEHWVERSNRLGREMGLEAPAVEFRMLLIQIKVEDVVPTMDRCLRETPASVLRD